MRTPRTPTTEGADTRTLMVAVATAWLETFDRSFFAAHPRKDVEATVDHLFGVVWCLIENLKCIPQVLGFTLQFILPAYPARIIYNDFFFYLFFDAFSFYSCLRCLTCVCSTGSVRPDHALCRSVCSLSRHQAQPAVQLAARVPYSISQILV